MKGGTRKVSEGRGLFERDGAWWIRYSDEHGIKHREKVGTKSAARDLYIRRKAAVRERRFNVGVIRRVEKSTGALIAELVHERRNRAGARNFVRYGKMLTAAFGDKPLRQLTQRDVERYRAQRQDEGVGPQTIYHELSFLRTVCSAAIKADFADENPVQKLKAPRAHRVRYLTDEEEARLLQALPPKWEPLVVFAIHTGLRQGEQFGARRAQVDWHARVIKLPKTKSGHPRTVPLNDTALAALRQLAPNLKSDRLFVNRFGAPINVHNFLSRVFGPALEAATIADFHWHDLRHTFASRMVAAGADLPTVAELLGHRSIQMVMRYAHLQPGGASRAVKLLDARRSTSSSTKVA